ncbi:MAG: hypothetical protein QNJ54_24310, partial [Prochloraceae cyanobacterium]|nr:hypothetical protein [Prochloraceae cyanobacterium]
SFLFPDLIFLGEIICQPDRLIVKDIFETRQDEILTAYLNYQTFKEELHELKTMFSEFWDFVEANILD